MRIDAIHRRHGRSDRHLGRVFIRNAERFFSGTDEILPLFPDSARHFMAIAVELALKAYLLHRGISDDWNRIHVRHDLTKALKSATRAGFKGAPPGLAKIAVALSPYYKTHTLPQMPAEILESIDWMEAHQIIASLLAAVRVVIPRDAASAPARDAE